METNKETIEIATETSTCSKMNPEAVMDTSIHSGTRRCVRYRSLMCVRIVRKCIVYCKQFSFIGQ